MSKLMKCSLKNIALTLAGFLLILAEIQAQNRVDELRKILLDADGRVMVASHRAVHNRYPENSLAAIQEAIDLGIDIIEIDVKITKDSVPILMHDRTIDRTTTGKGDPETLTFEEIQQFFLVENGKPTKHKIPTLEEALNLAHGKILVDLDMKTDWLENVIKVVHKTNATKEVFFFDSDYEVLKRLQAADKNFMLMPRTHSLEEVDSAIALFSPEIIHIDYSFYTKEVADRISKAGARIWINALGQPDRALREGHITPTLNSLTLYGADVIQTDEPALIQKSIPINPIRKPKHAGVYVVAHRGAHQNIPENTLAAYQKAIDLGADFVEVDIRTSKDGELVSIHNKEVDKYILKGKTGLVADKTLKELQKLDIGSRVDKKWKSERIPTFEEILKLCKGKIGIYLDVKDADVDKMLALIEKYEMQNEIFWYASVDKLKEVQAACPDCLVMPDPDIAKNLDKVFEAFKPSIIAANWEGFSEEGYEEKAHKNSAIIIVDDNGSETWQKALDLGCNGIQTDDPEGLINFLNSIEQNSN